VRTRSTTRALATTISRPPQRIEIVEIRDITRHCGDAFADLGLRPIKCALASSHDKDIGACLCRSLRSRQPNSARASSDNGDFALLGSTSHVSLRRTTATLVMRRLDIPIATGLDLVLQRSVGRCYFDKWLWRRVNWRKNWLRVAKQHKNARRTRIRCPTSGNYSLLTWAARPACGPFFLGEFRSSEQKCVARQMRNEFAALTSSSQFPAGIKHTA
jgi:hypothetical protein